MECFVILVDVKVFGNCGFHLAQEYYLRLKVGDRNDLWAAF